MMSKKRLAEKAELCNPQKSSVPQLKPNSTSKPNSWGKL
jgi:hypothetical protein